MRPARKTLIDFAFVLGGKFSNMAVVFLGGLFVARTSGPVEYGIFSVAMTLVLMCDGFIGAPLDLAAVRFFALHSDDEGRARRFEALTLQVKIMAATAAFGLLFIVRALFTAHLPVLAFPDVPLSACYVTLLALLAARSTATGLQNRHQFRLYSALDFFQGLTRAAGYGALGIFHALAAVAGVLVYGVAALVVALTGWFRFGQRYLLGPWPVRDDTTRLLRYCGYAAGIIIMATLTGRGDLLLLASRKGAGASSGYALASQLAFLITQVAMYATVLTQPRVLRLYRDGRIRGLFAWNAVAVAVLGIGIFLFWSPAVVERGLVGLMGPGFAVSVPLLKILILGVLLDYLILPLALPFCLQECPGPAFLGELVLTAAFLGAATLAVYGQWNLPAEVALAWIAVWGRAGKLLLYAGLFLGRSAAPSKKAPPEGGAGDS